MTVALDDLDPHRTFAVAAENGRLVGVFTFLLGGRAAFVGIGTMTEDGQWELIKERDDRCSCGEAVRETGASQCAPCNNRSRAKSRRKRAQWRKRRRAVIHTQACTTAS